MLETVVQGLAQFRTQQYSLFSTPVEELSHQGGLTMFGACATSPQQIGIPNSPLRQTYGYNA